MFSYLLIPDLNQVLQMSTELLAEQMNEKEEHRVTVVLKQSHVCGSCDCAHPPHFPYLSYVNKLESEHKISFYASF